jgi:hypothetical protein
VIGRTLVQRNPYKLPNGQRISRPARDSSLTIDPFEVAYQQQPKIDSWRQAGPSHRRRIERLAFPFHESVKIVFREELIQAHVKGMAGGPSQGAGWNPKPPLLLPPRSHRITAYGNYTG